MFKRGQKITNPADFQNAMLFATPIEVWQKGEVIDSGGPIEKYDDNAVYINGGYFLKQLCEFKVK